MAVCEKVVALDPKCADLHNKLGRLYLKKDYASKAIEHYQKAVEEQKVDPEFREDLAMAHYCNGDFPAAISELKRCSFLDARNSDYAKALGLLYAQTGEDEEAIRCLQAAQNLGAQDAQTHTLLGQVMARRGLVNMAIGSYQKAIELEPGNPILSLYLARALAAGGRHPEALTHFRHFAKNLSRAEDGFYLAQTQVDMGLSYLAGGDLTRASEVLRLALKSNPRDARALHGLAKVGAEKNDWVEAREFLAKAQQLEPKNIELLITLADIQGREGNWNEAVLTLQRGVTENPANAELHELLGRSLRKAGRALEAASVFRRAAEVFPAHQGRFYWLEARVEARRGRFGEAASLFRRALERNPESWRIYADLAETCQHLGDFQEGLALIERGLKVAPEGAYEELKRLQLTIQTKAIRG